jgi:hypothetical protein
MNGNTLYQRLSEAEDNSFIQERFERGKLRNLQNVDTSTVNPVATPITKFKREKTYTTQKQHFNGYGPSSTKYRSLYTYNTQTNI